MMTRLLNICSTLLRPGLKPACSVSSFSALALSPLRLTWNIILLGWLIRLMVRYSRHCSRFPFFGKDMITDCVHSFGHSFVSQIFWHIAVWTVVVASPPLLSSSEGMLSNPEDFPTFRLRTASSTVFFTTGRLSASCVVVWLLWSRLVSRWGS